MIFYTRFQQITKLGLGICDKCTICSWACLPDPNLYTPLTNIPIGASITTIGFSKLISSHVHLYPHLTPTIIMIRVLPCSKLLF